MSLLLAMGLIAVIVVVALLLSGKIGGSDLSSEDPAKLAALLVTEIRLYNEDLVEKGQREKAIYAYLREDIERSRMMYEERLGEGAAGRHFDDALVRILAGGDRSVLGDRD